MENREQEEGESGGVGEGEDGERIEQELRITLAKLVEDVPTRSSIE